MGMLIVWCLLGLLLAIVRLYEVLQLEPNNLWKVEMEI